MKRSWWAVVAAVVAVSVVLLTQPWRLLAPASEDGAADDPRPTEQASGPAVPTTGAWTATPDGAGEIVEAEQASGEGVRVRVDPDAQEQEWRGVGGALTDASVELLQQAPQETWGELLGPVSWVRLPLTSTDFSTEDWTWGWDGERATPHPRAEAAVEVVRQLVEQRPDLQVVVTPWSAPSAMKTSDSLRGGALRDDVLDDYAAMLASQVEELVSAGVPVAAVTLGNEPTVSHDYASMTMTPDQQAELGDLLVEDLPADVELWAGDDNWADRDYVDQVLSASPFGSFEGAAFHCYEGDPAEVEPLPVPSILTECTGTTGPWDETFAWDLRHLVVDGVRAGSTGLMMWNLALDPDHGPRDDRSRQGCADCRGLLTVDGEQVAPGPELTVLTMLDRAAPKGSRVVGSRVDGDGIDQVAFEAPDGTVGVLLRNAADAPTTVSLSVGGEAWPSYDVAPGALLVVRR